MKLLMPVFIKVTFGLLDVVSMHNDENVVSHFLAITRSFSDEPKHSSMQIHGGQKFIASFLIVGRIFELSTNLICELLLSML